MAGSRAGRVVGRGLLPRVENEEGRETAVGEAPVELELGTLRPWHTHRHVLVERLVARGALRDRGPVAWIVLVDPAGVIVLDLVVVPRDDPREGGVCGLKVRVRLVLRVAITVVGETEAP